jgi:hypothetical protein
MSEGTNDLGHGSFLDVVTNMVGVLIILVVVLGMRIKNAPLNLPVDTRVEVASSNLRTEEATERSLRSEIVSDTHQIEKVTASIQAQLVERGVLSTAVAAAEHVLTDRRSELSTTDKQEYDLARAVREAHAELNRLQVESQTLTNAVETVEVKCYPTPISHTVDGEELHFQLRAGRVAFVPMDELLRRFRDDAQHKLYKLRDQSEMTETIGPVTGFRMRYSLGRRNVTEDEFRATGRGGAVVKLTRFELIPLSNDLGETMGEAFTEGSDFLRQLSQAKPGRTTITLWIYPDAFELFRRVRQELYQRHFAIAGRPLPENQLIGGSPEGSKSAAE